MSVAYFVRFTGLQSPSNHQWFSIPAADFSFTRPVSIVSQSLQVGTPTAGALTLSLGSNSIDSTLLSDLTSGTGLTGIEIAGYTTVNGTTYLSDDYQFSAASSLSLDVTSVTSGADSADAFAFSYGKYQEAHRTSASGQYTYVNRSFGGEPSSYNSVFAGPEPTTNNGSATPALTYYVKITDTLGTAIKNDAGSTWIAVTNPSFSIANSGTAKAGALSFSLGSSSATQALQQEILGGNAWQTVELASYDSSGKLVDDTTFSTALETNATIDASNGGSQTFSFTYGAYQDVQTAATSSGGSTTTASGWDFLKNTSLAASLPTTAATSAPAATSNAPTVYFVKFTGLQSPSNHQWFSIPAADFSFTRPVSIVSQSLQVGTPTAGALTLSLGSNSIDSTLLSDLTSGTGLTGIEIAGYTTVNGTTYLSDDYQFSAASTLSLDVTSVTSGADSADAFAFSYGKYQEAHRTSASGQYTYINRNFGGDPSSYNLISAVTEPTTNNGSATPALTYYVKITDTLGTAIKNDAGSTWIAVTNPSFSIANSGTAKAGALSFSLGSSSATQALQQEILGGNAWQTVELASYDASNKLVDDVTFSKVAETSATIDASNGGSQTFSFTYGAYQDVQTAATSSGGSTTTASGWDFLKNTSLAASLPTTAATTAPAATSNAPTVYFVKFTGLQSPSNHQWFSIPAADFSFTRPVSSSSNGLSTGTPTAGALTLSLGSNSIDSTLLSDLTSGTGLTGIEIAGYTTVNGTTYLSDDYQFSAASSLSLAVTSVTSGADSADAFAFSYGKYQEAHRTSASGQYTYINRNFGGDPSSYNLISAVTEPTTNNGSATPALTYYVKITDTLGTAIKNDAGSTWIAVTNPSFSIANSGTAKAGALSFSLGSSSATQALQQEILGGNAWQTVELASYDASNKLVDDVTFSKVAETSATIDASNSDSQTFSFDYLAYQDKQTAVNSGGTPTTTTTGWNFATSAADTSLPATAADTICFLAGTGIATPGGERPIETLRRGDLVLTHDGRTAPVLWLGVQTVSRRFADPLRTLPIRIRAGALEDGVPKRDLYVSPDHALLVDGVLIQAGALVNGTSITRETSTPETFKYYHVETEGHALILAEGAPAETFVDNVDRMNFDNWAEHEALYPNGRPIDELDYPRAKARRQVPLAMRKRLDERAAVRFGRAA